LARPEYDAASVGHHRARAKRRANIGKVSAGATMSLDGFIAGPEDTGFDLLFKWYSAGDVEVPMPDSTAGVPVPHVSSASAELLR
jgi:hypothetical protein